ncbi:MAG: dienelactone hydrolase, partial [Acidobacteriota bacterium]|nr:dienelactone hydrolase [Acidobacteriota bacterium]
DKATGKAPLYARPLKLEVWYPAIVPAGKEEREVYTVPMPVTGPNVPATFQLAGKALRDAQPVKGERYPLVVLSHGYPGSRTFMSWLGENLASRGYVVASIDHTDSVFGAVRAFTSTLLNRSADQLFAIDSVSALSKQPDSFLNGIVDTSNVAIVGYSMGGYGALATAGAPYSKQGSSARAIPGGYFDAWTDGDPRFAAHDRSPIKALVAIAPWGNQPPNNNWDAHGLARIGIPSLFIDGSEDDVSGYANGVRKAFEEAVNSERFMLVYDNARHNVGGNPPPPEALMNFAARAFFDEPVWRKDRIVAIDQHFISAFLDLYLKHLPRMDYLTVPEKSNDTKWNQARGQDAGAYSTGTDTAGNPYWKGFQRRWALGLEMKHYSAGQAAK